MTSVGSTTHRMMSSATWEPARPAEIVHGDIVLSRSTSNVYLVASTEGDVVINTGTLSQGPRHRERFEQLLGRPLDVKKIVLTQSHSDHIGGWPVFDGPGVETIAQRNFPDGRLDWTLLAEFAGRRGGRLFSVLTGRPGSRDRLETVDPLLSTTFDDFYVFEVGGRRFELYSVPGGEITDGLAVWLPEEKTVFTGNLLGALYGQLPHLYTLRGDRVRSARLFIRSVNRVIDLEPETMITGHDEPIEGAARIRADLTRIRDATEYIHDETVKGMNAGKDLWTLMSEIKLPAHLEPARQGRGRVLVCARGLGGIRRLVPIRVDDGAVPGATASNLERTHRSRRRPRRPGRAGCCPPRCGSTRRGAAFHRYGLFGRPHSQTRSRHPERSAGAAARTLRR